MSWKRYLFVGCIAICISEYQADESLSFSPLQSDSHNFPISYWYGNKTIFKDSSMLEEGVDIDLYINKYQGRLFYSIDNKYRTFWVEFDQDKIAISYYNFIIEDVDKRIYKLEKICGQIYDNKVNLKFILKNKEILVKCNANTHPVEYFMPTGPISDVMLENFIKIMVLPIPMFNSSIDNQETQVHLWIGNTPATNEELYVNKVQLKPSPLNLLGCILRFTINDMPLKIASTGDHNGELISKSCNPVCQSTPCKNSGYCVEHWRGRSSCNCKLSRFIGDFCDEDYAVKFDGNLVVGFSKYFKLQKVQFSFQPYIFGESNSQKILSIKFNQDYFIQVYRDSNSFLHARFLSNAVQPNEIYFRSVLVDLQNYTLSIETDINGLILKLADAQLNSVLDQRTMRLSENNLIINEVLLGESHNPLMSWMKKFQGCLSNFVLTYNQKRFVWNEIREFPSLPKCGVGRTTPTSVAPAAPSDMPPTNDMLLANENSKPGKKPTEIFSSSTTIIAIGATILIVLILIVIIVVFRWRRRGSMKLNYEEKLILKPNHISKNNTDPPFIISNNSPKTSLTPITFKPAYTARSMTSSLNGRSMISLPMCNTPPLVAPEEGPVL